MIKTTIRYAGVLLTNTYPHILTHLNTIHAAERYRHMNKDTKRMISDLAVTTLVISFLGFLVWLVYYFQTHKLVLQVIST